MTLTADRGLDGTDWTQERRGQSRERRRSWASAQPFEPRRTAYNSDDPSLTTRWSTVAVDYSRATALTDLLLGAAVGVGVGALTDGLGLHVLTWGGLGGVGVLASVAASHGYRSASLGDGPAEFQAVLRATAVLGLVLLLVDFLTAAVVPREAVLLGLPTVGVGAVLVRHLHRRRLHRWRQRGGAMMRTVVVGDAASALRVVHDLSGATHHGYQIEGVCLPSAGEAEDVNGVPVLGATADVVQVVADRAADVVLVVGGSLSGEALRRLSWALGRAGAHLVVAPDLVEVAGPRLTVRPTAGLSLLEVAVGAPRPRLLMKAAIDRVVGGLALAAAAPVIGVAALAVAATSPGGAFYRQTRVGLDGATFTMWKLRTMVRDSDARRAELLVTSDRDGLMFKMHADPRITRVGRVLRRYSIDELPQLWNVLRGDMSLVGPRPPLLEEVQAYPDPVRRRLHVRPGLTGLWQVSGRADLDWEESVRLDLRYVDNWSVAMDLMILWKTGRAVLGGSGAY